MERGAHIELGNLRQLRVHDLLLGGAHPSERQAHRVLVVGAHFLALFHLNKLLGRLGRSHEAGGLVDLAPAAQILDALLLDLDVDKDEGVEPGLPVGEDLLVPAVRAPAVRPEAEGHGLAVAVELKPAAADGVHDAGVVDDLNGDAFVTGSENKVGMSGGAEGVPDNKEGDVLGAGLEDDLLLNAAPFDKVAVGGDDGLAIKIFETAWVDKKRGVAFKIDGVAGLDGFETTKCDVLGVEKTYPNDVKHCYLFMGLEYVLVNINE